MEEQEAGHKSYEGWTAVMQDLLQGDLAQKQLAFLKLNRLVSGVLISLQAWDIHDHWEDLQQTILMKLVKGFSQGQLREPQAFVAYVRTVTRNEFYDFLKARWRLGSYAAFLTFPCLLRRCTFLLFSSACPLRFFHTPGTSRMSLRS